MLSRNKEGSDVVLCPFSSLQKVCTKCGIETLGTQKRPLWLCKICSEQREVKCSEGAGFQSVTGAKEAHAGHHQGSGWGRELGGRGSTAEVTVLASKE